MTPNFSGINFHIITFGCQMNKHDSERVCGMFESLGATNVDTVEKSDLVVYLTCCVREAADVRLYGQASSIKNVPLRPDSPLKTRIIAIGGCVGQRDGKELINNVKNVSVVFGTHNLGNLPNLVQKAIDTNNHVVEIFDKSAGFPTDLPTHRENFWAAWLPITIGCNNFCSYCIVPYVRGREKSRTIEDIINEAKIYKTEGVKELTLLGQNVNSYGRDMYGKPQFYKLLCEIDKLGFDRLRFATSHPKDISDEVIDAFGSLKTLQPALHLPVQSGSNRILKAMNRRYTAQHYMDLINKLRQAKPDIALSTDIIVGFPGETQEDFDQTYKLIDEVGYHQVFTFIYSKRTGTPAAKIVDDTPKETIQNRFNSLVKLVADKAYALNQQDLNTTVNVLFEGQSKKDSSILVGKSPKNQTVHAKTPSGNVKDYTGKILKTNITEAKTWYLSGSICEDEIK